jgi:P-type Ca2+ transporter type 2C
MVPVQLLWVNLVTDGPPATALGFNPSDADIMRKPPRRSDDMLISPWVFFRYLVVGTYVGVATVGVFVYWYTMYNTALDGHSLITFDQLRYWAQCDASALVNPSSVFYKFSVANTGGIDIGSNPCKCVIFSVSRGVVTLQCCDRGLCCSYFVAGKVKAVSMSLSVLVVIEMFNALNALSEDGSLLQMPPWCNPWLLVAITVSMGVHAMIMYVPWMATLFQITALDQQVRSHVVGSCLWRLWICCCVWGCQDWIVIVLFSFPVVLIDEVLKLIGRVKQAAELKARMAQQKKSD